MENSKLNSPAFTLTVGELIEIINNKTQPEPTPAPPQEQPQYLYSMQELADFLHVSIVTAQKIKNSGTIHYTQVGRKLIFNSLQIMEDLAKKKGANNG